MRRDTLRQIKEAVCTLENNFISPMEGCEIETIELKKAIEYVYKHLQHYSEVYVGNTTAINFDGKNEIMEEIKAQILANKWIKIS